MFYNILDEKRKNILSFFEPLKDDFYLTGGTVLALQIGHRDSVDFDFFSEKDFETRELFGKIKEIFVGHRIKKIQDEKNTLTIYDSKKSRGFN